MANVKLLATDETYRRYVGLLAPGAWRLAIHQRGEAISSAQSKSQP